mmetsp:Transcript_13543/g.47088  ORF Transcript_13543/g.47088 Transcript_13543/m.47088 type:complete len:336 (+) Transcript_13543:573-1580(+)
MQVRHHEELPLSSSSLVCPYDQMLVCVAFFLLLLLHPFRGIPDHWSVSQQSHSIPILCSNKKVIGKGDSKMSVGGPVKFAQRVPFEPNARQQVSHRQPLHRHHPPQGPLRRFRHVALPHGGMESLQEIVAVDAVEGLLVQLTVSKDADKNLPQQDVAVGHQHELPAGSPHTDVLGVELRKPVLGRLRESSVDARWDADDADGRKTCRPCESATERRTVMAGSPFDEDELSAEGRMHPCCCRQLVERRLQARHEVAFMPVISGREDNAHVHLLRELPACSRPPPLPCHAPFLNLLLFCSQRLYRHGVDWLMLVPRPPSLLPRDRLGSGVEEASLPA